MKALTFKVVPSTYHLVPFIKALNKYAPFNPEKVKEMKEKLNISDSSEENQRKSFYKSKALNN
ncbi:hypothetical protein FZ989_05365 [Clostridium perfringens]|nr:hypothetical protein [Clostridium perfringens]